MIKAMKKITLIMAFIALLCSCSSKEEAVEPVPEIVGDWKLTEMTLTKALHIGSEEIEIYMSFEEDSSFELWQYLGAGRYEYFTGSWRLDGEKLTGKYSDGSAWGNSYKISCASDKLVMEAVGKGSDIYTYTRTTIPATGPVRP